MDALPAPAPVDEEDEWADSDGEEEGAREARTHKRDEDRAKARFQAVRSAHYAEEVVKMKELLKAGGDDEEDDEEGDGEEDGGREAGAGTDGEGADA